MKTMHFLGPQTVEADTPCNTCGEPLSLLNEDGSPSEICGIWCEQHQLMHSYHVACLTPTQQVEIMLAQMKGRGML